MQIKPKSEKELQEEGLFKAGVYPCEVVKAEDKKSKAGNDMIELNLKVFSNEGNGSVYVRDWLLESMGHKLRHATVRLIDEATYESGEFGASDFTGRTGFVKLGIEKGKDAYPDKNKVLDYVEEPVPATGGDLSADQEDDIPFN